MNRADRAAMWARIAVRNEWSVPPSRPRSIGGRVAIVALTLAVVAGALALNYAAWRAVFGLALLALPFAGLVVRPDVRCHRSRRTGRDGTGS